LIIQVRYVVRPLSMFHIILMHQHHVFSLVLFKIFKIILIAVIIAKNVLLHFHYVIHLTFVHLHILILILAKLVLVAVVWHPTIIFVDLVTVTLVIAVKFVVVVPYFT